jgi:Tetratricopeptide repeat
VTSRFLSGEESGRGAPRGAPPARESQQALLLRVLREAAGATVSYAELRDAGIDLPASVVSELELAGIPIDHSYEGAGGARRRPGVRLNPALDPERAVVDAADGTGEAADGTDGAPLVRTTRNRVARSVDGLPLPSFRGWTLTPIRRVTPSLARLSLPSLPRLTLPSLRGINVPSVTRFSLPVSKRLTELRPATRALAPIAVLGAMIVVIAIVVLALQAGSRHGTAHHAAKVPPRSASVVAKAPSTPPPATPSTPVSPALATQFEAQGHDLLQSGQYSDAIPVLRRALAATGKQLSDCVEPVSETCLTYAYALYDLGRALELNGEPSAALPVLEQRFQIDDQRDVVAAELAHVRTIAQP